MDRVSDLVNVSPWYKAGGRGFSLWFNVMARQNFLKTYCVELYMMGTMA